MFKKLKNQKKKEKATTQKKKKKFAMTRTTQSTSQINIKYFIKDCSTVLAFNSQKFIFSCFFIYFICAERVLRELWFCHDNNGKF